MVPFWNCCGLYKQSINMITCLRETSMMGEIHSTFRKLWRNTRERKVMKDMFFMPIQTSSKHHFSGKNRLTQQFCIIFDLSKPCWSYFTTPCLKLSWFVGLDRLRGGCFHAWDSPSNSITSVRIYRPAGNTFFWEAQWFIIEIPAPKHIICHPGGVLVHPGRGELSIGWLGHLGEI